jgi:hypothetical protein
MGAVPNPLKLTPQQMHDYFYWLQMGLGVAFFGAAWAFLRPKDPGSNFKVREADLRKPPKPGQKPAPGQDLASARIARNEPMRLAGIRIDGTPHEILGVRVGAGTEEIQKAYRELMKRYHPDKVGAPGSREWHDAQKIAEAINRAKDQLLKKR